MPWALCTTGSPTLSSLRSLISASTSLTCSCFLRRRVVGPAANSSVSVTKSMPGSTQPNPTVSGATAMPSFSSLASNSASESKAGGEMLLARKKSSRLLWRAFAFGQHQHPVGAVADVVLQLGQGLVGAAHHGQAAELGEGGVVDPFVQRRANGELRVLVGRS